MSESGHLRRLSDVGGMSDSPPTPAVFCNAANGREVPKATFAGQQTAMLFDNLVGAGEKRGRDFDAERLGGAQIDQKLELCWTLTGIKLGFAPFSILST